MLIRNYSTGLFNVFFDGEDEGGAAPAAPEEGSPPAGGDASPKAAPLPDDSFATPGKGAEGEPKGEPPAPDVKAVPRPEEVPEKFWNTDKGEVNVESLLKAQQDAEKTITKKRDESGVPQKASDYFKLKENGEIFLPEGLDNLPSFRANDIVLEAVSQAAHEADVSTTQMDAIMGAYFKANDTYLSQFVFDAEAVRDGVDVDPIRAENTISGINVYMGQFDLADGQREVYADIMKTSDGINLMATMIRKAGVEPIREGSVQSRDSSMVELRAEWKVMLKNPEKRDTDAAYQRRFEEVGAQING